MLLCAVPARAISEDSFYYEAGDIADGFGTNSVAIGEPEMGPIARSATRSVPGTDAYGRPLPDNFYLYRQLLNQTELAAYDEVANAIASYNPYIQLQAQVTTNQIENIVTCVILDHPEFFWAQTEFGVRYSGSGIVQSVTMYFNMSESDIPTAKTQMEQSTQWILAYASRLGTNIEKVKAVHDYILHTVDYIPSSTFNQSAYGALVRKECVCAGYAKAFQYLMHKLSIPCTAITGIGTSNTGTERHQWNMLELDGEYYIMDTTWDDPYRNPPNSYHYSFFNITDAQASRDHRRDPLCERIPTATGTRYAYSYFGSNAAGTDFSGYDAGETLTLPPEATPEPTPTPTPEPTPTPTPIPTPDILAYYSRNADGTYTLTRYPSNVNLTEIDLSSATVHGQPITGIGDNAFSGMSDVTSIVLPTTLTTIGEYAFSGTGIESITLPRGVTSIGSGAFRNCNDLVSVTFQRGIAVSELPEDAFQDCSSLESINVPASVTTIGEDAFSGCTALSDVRLHDTLQAIRNGAFSNCPSLRNVYFDGTQEEFEDIDVRNDNSALREAQLHFEAQDPAGPAVTDGVWLAEGSSLTVDETDNAPGVIVPQGTVASAVLADLVTNNQTETMIVHSNGMPANGTDLIRTGDMLRTESTARSVTRVPLIVLGDVLGTGKTSVSQLVRMASALSGHRPLEDPYQRAADWNQDGHISVSDLIAVAHQLRVSVG